MIIKETPLGDKLSKKQFAGLDSLPFVSTKFLVWQFVHKLELADKRGKNSRRILKIKYLYWNHRIWKMSGQAFSINWLLTTANVLPKKICTRPFRKHRNWDAIFPAMRFASQIIVVNDDVCLRGNFFIMKHTNLVNEREQSHFMERCGNFRSVYSLHLSFHEPSPFFFILLWLTQP